MVAAASLACLFSCNRLQTETNLSGNNRITQDWKILFWLPCDLVKVTFKHEEMQSVLQDLHCYLWLLNNHK